MSKLIDCPVCKGTGQIEKTIEELGGIKKGSTAAKVKVPCTNARCDEGKILV